MSGHFLQLHLLAQLNGPWILAISITTLVLGTAGGLAALIMIPGNYFSPRRRPKRKSPRGSWQHIALRIGKNIAGAAFLILGAVMMITPGPGIIFLLMGVSLVDIPGKHRLQRYLISRPFVLRSVNKLRAYCNRPKLVTS